jgi:hypothetical protein
MGRFVSRYHCIPELEQAQEMQKWIVPAFAAVVSVSQPGMASLVNYT